MDIEAVNRLLRSLCANSPEEEGNAAENYRRTNFTSVEFVGVAAKALDFIRDHFVKGGAPSTATIREMAERHDETELALYMEEVSTEEPQWGANYSSALERFIEDQGVESLKILLQETSQIATEGRRVGNSEVRGLTEAIHHVWTGTTEIRSKADPAHRSLSNVEATDNLHREYIERRDQPAMAYGMTTGLGPLDEATKGGQWGELWIIAGFVGNGKTTLACNWVRHLAVEGGFNALIFTLEMDTQQVWRILGCGHSSHPKWEGKEPLSYERIKSGTLSRDEEDFYLNSVLPDLRSPDCGRIEVEKPAGITTLADIRARAEALNRNHPLDIVVIDYDALISPSADRKASDTRAYVNENIKAAKQMALEFDQGHGVLVVMPHQINRGGFAKAQESGGVYELSALADNNEAERSADGIITIFQDIPLKQKKEAVITHLKNRDGAIVEPFNVYYPPEERFLADLVGVERTVDLASILEG